MLFYIFPSPFCLELNLVVLYLLSFPFLCFKLDKTQKNVYVGKSDQSGVFANSTSEL